MRLCPWEFDGGIILSYLDRRQERGSRRLPSQRLSYPPPVVAVGGPLNVEENGCEPLHELQCGDEGISAPTGGYTRAPAASGKGSIRLPVEELEILQAADALVEDKPHMHLWPGLWIPSGVLSRQVPAGTPDAPLGREVTAARAGTGTGAEVEVASNAPPVLSLRPSGTGAGRLESDLAGATIRARWTECVRGCRRGAFVFPDGSSGGTSTARRTDDGNGAFQDPCPSSLLESVETGTGRVQHFRARIAVTADGTIGLQFAEANNKIY